MSIIDSNAYPTQKEKKAYREGWKAAKEGKVEYESDNPYCGENSKEEKAFYDGACDGESENGC